MIGISSTIKYGYDARDSKAACEIFKNKTKLYVFTSTQSVYGWGSDLKETDFDPYTYTYKNFVSQKENYGEAKRQAEATFCKYATFPVQIVRFPIVIGTDDYTGRFKFHVDSVREQRPIYFPNINATISMISSEDAARFLFKLLEVKNIEIVNCASSFKLVLRDFMEEIASQNNQKIRYTADSKSGTISSYGVEQDWIMSTQKLTSQYGFVTKDNKEFISELISYFSNK